MLVWRATRLDPCALPVVEVTGLSCEESTCSQSVKIPDPPNPRPKAGPLCPLFSVRLAVGTPSSPAPVADPTRPLVRVPGPYPTAPLVDPAVGHSREKVREGHVYTEYLFLGCRGPPLTKPMPARAEVASTLDSLGTDPYSDNLVKVILGNRSTDSFYF